MEKICEYCNTKININSNNCPYCLREITKEMELNSLIDSILSQEIVSELLSNVDNDNPKIVIFLMFLIGLIASFLPIFLKIFIK